MVGCRSAVATRSRSGELIEEACHAVGRDPESIERGLFGAPPDEAKLVELSAAGFGRAVLGLPQGPRDDVMATLDELAPLVEALADA